MGYEPRIRHISALQAHTKVFNIMGYEPRIRRISAHFFFFLLALVMFVLLDYKGVVDDFIAHCSPFKVKVHPIHPKYCRLLGNWETLVSAVPCF
jgi:hypothetical protein